MKKKTLALIATIALVASLTACGGKTEETANNNTNEPVAESQVEQEDVAEPTEAPIQESEEVVENTEPVVEDASTTEEAPVEEETNEIPYSIEFVYCNEDSKNLEYMDSVTDDYLFQAMVPYAIITNTSNTSYEIEIDGEAITEKDRCFEPGEQLRVPVILDSFDENSERLSRYIDAGLVDMSTAFTLADEEENIIYVWCVPDIDIEEETDEDNFTRGMFTITQADVTASEQRNEFITINYNVPEELTDVERCKLFVVFYDEAGNEIGCVETIMYTGELQYHEVVANWASADIYYRYE